MRRVIVAMPKRQLAMLDRQAKKLGIARGELIRRIMDGHLRL